MTETAIFLADGFEEIEGLTIVDILRRAGIPITTLSINGTLNVMGSHGIGIVCDKKMEDADIDSFDMLILPGGKVGTDNLYNCAPLGEALDRFASQGKKIAAICAAPTVLGRRGLLKGKKATCYPGCEGLLTDAVLSTDSVAKDGNILTSRGMGTSIDLALAIVETYQGKESAGKLAKSIVYR
ncbi:MAG: DJ-1/PfpI family protein [Lachnospiraceae bacterium]|nr:DJ-1/PfpI family protein [Lachnospiraceae bacterium]